VIVWPQDSDGSYLLNHPVVRGLLHLPDGVRKWEEFPTSCVAVFAFFLPPSLDAVVPLRSIVGLSAVRVEFRF